MPNIATILKDEIRRLAKREIKVATGTTKQAVAQYRRDIARLKRLLHSQQKEIAFLKGQEKKRLGLRPTAEEPLEGVRFSARSVKAQRTRLKLSAADFGKLVGVSGLTIYHWESFDLRPLWRPVLPPPSSSLGGLVVVAGIGYKCKESLATMGSGSGGESWSRSMVEIGIGAADRPKVPGTLPPGTANADIKLPNPLVVNDLEKRPRSSIG